MQPISNKVGFSFTPKRVIPQDILLEIWSRLNSDEEMPSIDAFSLERDEFVRIIEYFHNTGSKMEGLIWEYGEILKASDTGAVNFPLWMCKTKTEFLILINESQDEEDCLIHELSHIANRDYLKFPRGREIYRMFRGEIPNN